MKIDPEHRKNVCRNLFCRKKRDCPFYIDNQLIVNTEDDLELLPDSSSEEEADEYK